MQVATRSTLIQAFGGLFLVTTAYFSWRNLKVSEEKQVTERFSKAVEQLGNADIHVRLGGIYALERISKDSERDYWQIMEIITAYVREKASVIKLEESEKVITPVSGLGIQVSTDIQAVLTVLTRRAKAYGQGEENPLDLSKSNLLEANLLEANLQSANLQSANLQSAYLCFANLQSAYLCLANLQSANLQGADLRFADLRFANLRFANLQGANLRQADLQGADLQGANLQGANFLRTKLLLVNLLQAYFRRSDLLLVNLLEADLQGADLRLAKNLTPEQVKTAKNWEDAEYEEEFRALLGLPPSVPESKN